MCVDQICRQDSILSRHLSNRHAILISKVVLVKLYTLTHIDQTHQAGRLLLPDQIVPGHHRGYIVFCCGPLLLTQPGEFEVFVLPADEFGSL